MEVRARKSPTPPARVPICGLCGLSRGQTEEEASLHVRYYGADFPCFGGVFYRGHELPFRVSLATSATGDT